MAEQHHIIQAVSDGGGMMMIQKNENSRSSSGLSSSTHSYEYAWFWLFYYDDTLHATMFAYVCVKKHFHTIESLKAEAKWNNLYAKYYF